MTIPFVLIEKAQGSLGVPPQDDPTNILAIIGPRLGPSGPSTPFLGTKKETILDTSGFGLLSDDAVYTINQTKRPVVIMPQEPSTASDYGDIEYVGTGTLDGDVTEGSSAPLDDFPVTVRFVAGGTTGVAGITYQTSIDARDIDDVAKVWSPVTALGTALTIEIEDTGVSFNLANADTVVAGDYFTCQTTGPRLTDGDLDDALDTLELSTLPWEVVLVDGLDASSTTVSSLDQWLEGLEAVGKFRAFIVSARMRAQDGSETEAQYLTAMTTAWNGVASIRGSVTADGEFLTSPTRGIDMVRKASVPYAAQLMAINVARDAAEVALGPLAGVRITDADGNLVYHDEETTGGLDAIRLATLRRWANRSGVFLTNPLVISSPGSDFVLMQQVRTMNRACEVAYGQMVSEMSKGVFTNPATQTIREDSAQAIDEPVNAAIEEAIGSQVQDFAFAIDRSQVLSAPTAILEGVIELVMTVYIKGFRVTARLVRRITVRTP